MLLTARIVPMREATILLKTVGVFDQSECNYLIFSPSLGIYPDYQPGGYAGPENCGTFKATNVISTSYGYNEADLTPYYEQRQCNEYAKLGLQGVSILYSSGDYGVAGNNDLCLYPNGTQGPDGSLFNPSFPGTCPYVTSVGATQIVPNGTVFDPEEASESVIYSGGGFSNNFAMPSYQAKAVEWFYEIEAGYLSTIAGNFNYTKKVLFFISIGASL